MPTEGCALKSNVLSSMVVWLVRLRHGIRHKSRNHGLYEIFLPRGKFQELKRKITLSVWFAEFRLKMLHLFTKLLELVGVPVETSNNLFKYMSKTSSILKFKKMGILLVFEIRQIPRLGGLVVGCSWTLKMHPFSICGPYHFLSTHHQITPNTQRRLH